MSALLVYVYSGLLILGGLIGFIKAGSMMSLIMGILSGFLAAYSANLQSYNKKSGLQLTMLVSFVLLIFMGLRYYNSQKFMPAGLVSIFSAIVLFKSYTDFQTIH
ncbi:transmembrane protein 14 A [Cavenderia fasciculata]|uniref:Transmembrane protein 14 A n=1 Tax=Cavenderia fasciculata TaxID=261658 RepID=F4Q1Q7_CACFS|nr:transmembrane protein 14 A [Cavenderia fasciculata]EGG18207.1 transmembrane protein 14 A [Cavenderia fasciculata]|eukprot:XP_004357030.1 transmembrane protein 14 A [Cavenderia fasciculata]